MNAPRHGRRLLAIGLAVAGTLLLSAPAHAGLITAGLTNDGRIVTFDADTPGTLLSSTTMTGPLIGGESFAAIDYRPATGLLYGMTNLSRIFLIDSTGVLTQVGPTFDTPLTGTAWDIDFNPAVDRLRIVSDAGQNMRWNPITGVIVDGDPGTLGTQPDVDLSSAGVAGLAHTNSDTNGATATTAYALSATADALMMLGGQNGSPSPNGGILTTIGPLGVDITTTAGLDVPLGGTTNAYALLTVAGVTGIYTVDLAGGAARSLGAVAPSAAGMRDIAVTGTQASPAPPPACPATGCGVTPPAPPPTTTTIIHNVRPSLTKLTATATSFAYTLNEAAGVRVTLARRTPGRQVGGKCVAATRKLRSRRRCDRYVAVGTVRQNGKAGRNTLKVPARVAGRKLARGTYRATFVGTDAPGLKSAAKRVTFTIAG